MTTDILYNDAVELLRSLIRRPSFSGDESGAAELFEQFLNDRGVACDRHLNNIWAQNLHFDPAKPTILLNSHLDTVKPQAGYTRDPHDPKIEDGKLFGLGANDAGASLVSLAAVFLHFYAITGMKYNLIIAATAEEEISGRNGIESLLRQIPVIDLAIVGEPTKMDLAIAEKGLMVLDCTVTGRSGHAAREEGENAVYKAMKDISWIEAYQFEKVSGLLGPVKMTVTGIRTQNTQHNVVPDSCEFMVDVRVNELYTHEELLEIIQQNLSASVVPRSMRIRASSIAADHPVVLAGIQLGRKVYGSPTSSDAALINAPVLKCGPGDSARSHTADEFVYLEEIREGISIYINMLGSILSGSSDQLKNPKNEALAKG